MHEGILFNKGSTLHQGSLSNENTFVRINFIFSTFFFFSILTITVTPNPYLPSVGNFFILLFWILTIFSFFCSLINKIFISSYFYFELFFNLVQKWLFEQKCLRAYLTCPRRKVTPIQNWYCAKMILRVKVTRKIDSSGNCARVGSERVSLIFYKI